MRTPLLLGLSLTALAIVIALQATGSAHEPTSPAASPAPAAASDLIARGEYLIRTSGCNDCHTPGYPESQGQMDKSQWLLGSRVGFKGPWGTTYASNLRLRAAGMDEKQWMDYTANLRTRPVMPDFNVRAMNEDDRRAIYHFIKSLGPDGEAAPAYLPPGQNPTAPYYELVLPAAVPPKA
ncbi:c-type cytochrome [Lysobacter niastensis]|uniref:C-type cytochrome n=1 Tax=Lysobacter niastensis TaxID=380629 RepID=A0ABS0B2K4_9GAMM|nr:c-type cytochrome [Lysobacter niastensis]MBF6022702.1 c-type cytochrome [Lysobacter niastensis]